MIYLPQAATRWSVYPGAEKGSFGPVLSAVRKGGEGKGGGKMTNDEWGGLVGTFGAKDGARQLYNTFCDVQMQRVNFYCNNRPTRLLKKWYISARGDSHPARLSGFVPRLPI